MVGGSAGSPSSRDQKIEREKSKQMVRASKGIAEGVSAPTKIAVTSFPESEKSLFQKILEEVFDLTLANSAENSALRFLNATPLEFNCVYRDWKVIHLSRDYRDVAFSHRHDGVDSKESATGKRLLQLSSVSDQDTASQLQSIVRRIIAFDNAWKLNPFDTEILYVTYEELRKQPKLVLEAVRDFLEIDWDWREVNSILRRHGLVGSSLGISPMFAVRVLQIYDKKIRKRKSLAQSKRVCEWSQTLLKPEEAEIADSCQHLVLDRTQLIKKNVDGFQWTLDISDGGIGETLAKASSVGKGFDFAREKLFMNTLDSVVIPGMTCIDVGANIGYATLIMARNCGDPRNVYAVEPDDHNVDLLHANLLANGFGECHISRCLISDRDGEQDFWLARHPNLNSVSQTKHSISKRMLQSMTLETLCAENQIYPNFIKMDIEGHEVSVFRGAYEFFKNNPGETHFLLEVHPAMYSEANNFTEVLFMYEEIGFKIKKLISTPVSNPAPFERLGYRPVVEVDSDGWVRSLYTGVKNSDAINLCTRLFDDVKGGKVVRAILVSRDV